MRLGMVLESCLGVTVRWTCLRYTSTSRLNSKSLLRLNASEFWGSIGKHTHVCKNRNLIPEILVCTLLRFFPLN